MQQDRQTTSVRERVERFTIADFAETAGIPIAQARRLIKHLGNDAATLMRAVSGAQSQAAQGGTASPIAGRDAQQFS